MAGDGAVDAEAHLEVFVGMLREIIIDAAAGWISYAYGSEQISIDYLRRCREGQRKVEAVVYGDDLIAVEAELLAVVVLHQHMHQKDPVAAALLLVYHHNLVSFLGQTVLFQGESAPAESSKPYLLVELIS